MIITTDSFNPEFVRAYNEGYNACKKDIKNHLEDFKTQGMSLLMEKEVDELGKYKETTTGVFKKMES